MPNPAQNQYSRKGGVSGQHCVVTTPRFNTPPPKALILILVATLSPLTEWSWPTYPPLPGHLLDCSGLLVEPPQPHHHHSLSAQQALLCPGDEIFMSSVKDKIKRERQKPWASEVNSESITFSIFLSSAVLLLPLLLLWQLHSRQSRARRFSWWWLRLHFSFFRSLTTLQLKRWF